MMHRFTHKLRWAVVGASAAALVLVTTTALAGSGVGGVFNLGQTNTVDAQNTLSGNPGANPLLRVTSSGTAATIRADGPNGPAVNGVSGSGIGQLGVHSGATGTAAGVEGDSASTAADAKGVFGKITSTSPGFNSAGVYGLNSSTGALGYGVFGKHNGGGFGVYGTSPSGSGVYGASSSGSGVWGISTSGYGVRGESSSSFGVYAWHSGLTGTAPGVRGDTSSTAAGASGVVGSVASTVAGDNSSGVLGQNFSTSNRGFGVRGVHYGSGVGVEGSSTSGTGVEGRGPNVGIRGFSTAANYGVGVDGCARSGSECVVSLSGNVGGDFESDGAQADGIDVVSGSSDGHGAKITSQNIGLTVSAPNDGIQTSSTAPLKSAIFAHHDGSADGYGVYATSDGGDGVHAYSAGDGKSALYGEWVGSTGSGWAGYFKGNLNVTGQIFAGTKDFRIDDPLDPAHKYLQHTSVESPDMMDIYNGNVTTDGKGFATVKLPRYFQALNRTFRYQLTSLSGLQEVAVAQEINHNQFTVQSEKPNSRVSWQVTGIRHDPYANANRTAVEFRKPAADQGRYIHPELYGKPRRLGENRVLAAGGHTH